VGGKPIHPNAGIHQIHSEWRRSHRSGSVAAEYFRIVPFDGQGSCRRIPELVGEPAFCTTNIRIAQYGRHPALRRYFENEAVSVAGIILSLSAWAQTNSQTTLAVEPLSPMPVFHVTVTSRSVQAVNYKHRSGASKLDFAGTDLMPAANGQAKVESKKGYTEIEVEFGNLQKPTTFGMSI
jgi:hypothetical protein